MLMELNLASQLQRYLGLDERELLASFNTLIPKCKSLVDIGANDGYYTLAFLKSSAECVVACEPGDALERLLHNVTANGYQKDGRFIIERRLVGEGEEQGVSVTALVNDLPGPILLKVDIDGGEFDLVRSAENCKRLSEIYWIMETHSKELEANCLTWFQANGYQTKVIKNAWWRTFLPEQRPLIHNRWLIAYQNL